MQLFDVLALGDIVVSLDTARRQAAERHDRYAAPAATSDGAAYTAQDELRVVLLHGLLHLLGMDHERGEQDARAMAAAEVQLMQQLGWRGQGLIEAAGGLNTGQQGGAHLPLWSL